MTALVFTGSWVLRHTKPLRCQPQTASDKAQAQREERLFNVINAVQWGAIFLAGWLLPTLGLAHYFTPVIALITALHFLLLARLFRYNGHYLTLLWALGCLLLVSPTAWQSRVALGTGLLWLSAGCSVGRAGWLLEQATPLPAAA